MTDRLPPNLLALFAPRPALRYLPPADHAPEERTTHHIDGVAAFVSALKEKEEADKDVPWSESWLEKRDRDQFEKQEKQRWLLEEGYKQLYKPKEDPLIRGEAFNTLFVSRLPFDCGTKDLEKEFGRFGPIERIRIVLDRGERSNKKGKSRGYAFVLYERERDMKTAYKESENVYIRGRKVIVDVERGRTVLGWRPRRFGGGLGGRHYTKPPPRAGGFGFGPPGGPGGFGRGGFRGGGFRSGPDRPAFGGGFRGGRGGRGGGGFNDRGGVGHGGGGPPDGAPSGPRTGGGYGGGGGGRFDDRGGGSRNNANFEPLPPRPNRYQDRDRDRDSSIGQKRPHDGGGYEDSRQRRRY